MSYCVLVDENTSPRVVDLLREKGHTAIHVTDALTVGVEDGAIADFATEHDYLVLTHDDDFLHPQYTAELSVLYYSDDTLASSELADRVDEVSRHVPDPAALPSVCNLGTWP